ncbi:MAG: aminotransferase class V-fold PLP-dependent enzyme [Planctomycetota bacterium]
MSPLAADTTSLRPNIPEALAGLGGGPLTEPALREHIDPLFSRVLKRDELYLANHSLGRPLDRMADDIREALDRWYEDMDGAWGPWMDAIGRYRELMARLIGCARPDAIVPKTSAGQGLRAALGSLGKSKLNVVTTTGEFDSIEIVLKAWQARGAADVTWVPAGTDRLFRGSDVADAISPQTDAVVVSQVIYATGQVVDGIDQVIERAHAVGAAVILDTYHAAGAMPVEFDRLGADFAIGGNYKYTRGGAGACWLAIHPRHLRTEPHTAHVDGLFPLDTGWFAKANAFDWARPDAPSFAEGGNGWLESTPPVLAFIQALAGLELTVGLRPDRLRAYNLEQQAVLIDALRAKNVPVREIDDRGAFVLIPTDDLTGSLGALKAEGLNADGRPDPAEPRSQAASDTTAGNIRLCPDILTRPHELARAATIVAEVLAT